MSQRKARTRKTKPPKDEPAAKPINGVLVALDDDGGRQLQVLGSAKVTELPTLLRLAAKDVERELGIE